MVTAIKILVKIIKIFIIFEKDSNGPISQLIELLEGKIKGEEDESTTVAGE